MAEQQATDVRLSGYTAYRSRRRMQRIENRRRAGRIENDAVEHQQIRVARNPSQMVEPFGIDVAGEGHALAPMVDTVNHRWSIAMVPRDRAYLEAAFVEDEACRFAAIRGQVVRNQGHRRGEIAQIRERALRT